MARFVIILSICPKYHRSPFIRHGSLCVLCVLMLFIVPHPIPGGKLTAKILNKLGEEVPPSEYDLEVDGEDFTFTFKHPTKDKSGRYTLVFSYEGAETSVDFDINFPGRKNLARGFANLPLLDVPSPPTEASVSEVFSSSCLLAWKEPLDNGGSPITHYIIERKEAESRDKWQEVGETTADIMKLKCDQLVEKKKYRFRVRAANKVGTSEPCELKDSVLAKDPWDVPGPPLDLEAKDWDTSYVDLEWNSPLSDGGAEITRYLVECQEKFSSDWVKCHMTDDATCKAKVEDVIKAGKSYQFRVRAINKAGEGKASEPCKQVSCKSRFVQPFLIGDEMKDLVVKRGKNLSWDLKFGGEPEPEAEWFFGDTKIEADDR